MSSLISFHVCLSLLILLLFSRYIVFVAFVVVLMANVKRKPVSTCYPKKEMYGFSFYIFQSRSIFLSFEFYFTLIYIFTFRFLMYWWSSKFFSAFVNLFMGFSYFSFLTAINLCILRLRQFVVSCSALLFDSYSVHIKSKVLHIYTDTVLQTHMILILLIILVLIGY